MAQASASGAGAGGSHPHNSSAGKVLIVRAGEHALATFDVVNKAPDVADIEVRAQGLPTPSWALPEATARVRIAPQGRGQVTLKLSPPRAAVPSDYPFTARALDSDGEVVGQWSCVLRVRPSDAHPDGAGTPSNAAPSQLPPRSNSLDELPSSAPPTHAASAHAPAQGASAAPTSTPATGNIAPSVVPPHAGAPATATTTSPPASAGQSADAGSVEAQAAASQGASAVGAEREKPKALVEHSILDPHEGMVFSMRPGETQLLRFSFTNDGVRERKYVLEEDREIEKGWVKLVKDQVDLSRGATGEALVHIMPPLGAEPKRYPFALRIGPEGGVLQPRNLILSVTAVPCVCVSTQKPHATTWFGRSVDFALSVQNAGNTGTAFRIAVKQQNGAGNSYESEDGKWRYLFDREIDTLQKSDAGSARLEDIVLRVQRKGVWWWKCRESHQVDVAAVPVTDPSNGGNADNIIRLTATRRRLLPFPKRVLLPLLLGLVALSGSPSDVRVVNAYDADGVSYILQVSEQRVEDKRPRSMSAALRWSAPVLSLLGLRWTDEKGKAGSSQWLRGGHDDQVAVAEYGTERAYEVGSLLRPGGEAVTVRFVPVRTANKLAFSLRSNLEASNGVDLNTTMTMDKPVDFTEVKPIVQGGLTVVNLIMPASGTVNLFISNTVPKTKKLRIHCWLAQKPKSYKVGTLLEDSNNSMDPGGEKQIQITRDTTVSDPDPENPEELVLITTDKNHQVVRIKLYPPGVALPSGTLPSTTLDSLAAAEGASEVKRDSSERHAIFEALRPQVQAMVRTPVLFMGSLKSTKSGWAAFQGRVRRNDGTEGGQPLEFKGTDGEMAAVMRWSGGKWNVASCVFGSGTEASEEALRQAPEAPRQLLRGQ